MNLKSIRLNPALFLSLTLVLLADPGYGQFWKKKVPQVNETSFFDEAVKLYNRNEYEEALTILVSREAEVEQQHETEYRLLLMKCYRGSGYFESARSTGRDFIRKFPLSRYTPEVFITFGDMFIDEGNYPSAFRMYIDARRIESNRQSITRINQRLIRTVQLGIPLDILDELLALEFDSGIRNVINLARAFTYLGQGDPLNCARTLNTIRPLALEDTFTPLYEKLFLASYEPPVRTVTVGVVAPLTGVNREQGEAFISGLKKKIAEEDRSGINLTYIVRDNQGDDVETIRQIKFLKNHTDVEVIVGPLNDENVLAAAASMEGEEIPLLIPYSKSDKIGRISSNIYQLDASYALQGRSAARFSAQLGTLPEIAILAPADQFGQEMVDAYLEELDRLDLHPAVVEWYYDLPEDLNRQFASIRKTAWSLVPANEDEKYLDLEIDSLDALFDVSPEDFFNLPVEDEPEMSSSDSLKTVLETIDVIFIPVHPEHLKYLATQLPMHNLNARVIGSAGWLNKDILGEENISPHFDGLTVLTTQFFPDSIQLDNALSNRMPEYLTGIDVNTFLTSIFSVPGADTTAFKDKLMNVDVIKGASRFIDFQGGNRQMNGGVQIIEYSHSQLTPRGFFAADSLRLINQDNP